MKNLKINCSTCQDWGTLNNGKICPDCPPLRQEEKDWLAKIGGPMPEAVFFCKLITLKGEVGEA